MYKQMKNKKEILRKDMTLQRMQVGSVWFFLGCSRAPQYCRYLLYTVAAIFREKTPYYRKPTPFYVGLSRTVSAKTTPIKVDDLNRGAYASSKRRRKEETSNTTHTSMYLRYVALFWRKINGIV